MAREQAAAGAETPAAAAAVPNPLVEVRFRRRWRGYNAGDRANFLPTMADQLIRVGYGDAVVTAAAGHPTVRK